MEPSATNVEEVVVVGYGVQKKQSVVGAISSATSEDLKQMGSPNLSTALAGKVAGVTAGNRVHAVGTHPFRGSSGDREENCTVPQSCGK